MDLTYTPEEEAFRQEVRTFVRDNLAESTRRKVERGLRLDKHDYVGWQQALYRRGWAAPNWPVEYGGTGWTPVQHWIFEEETARGYAPRIIAFGLNMVGPVIIQFGSEMQKKRFLPRILSSEDWWCQGFSEPGAGSDLASLKTRAVRDGDHFVINGQKTWTTLAQHADMMFCLVRTDPNAKKQEGISFILIDMKTPGITVRPIYLIDGEPEVNEVFFDDVRVPAENLVGEINKGWDYAKFLLGYERTGIAVDQVEAAAATAQAHRHRRACGWRTTDRQPALPRPDRQPRDRAAGPGDDQPSHPDRGAQRHDARPRGIDAQDQGHRDPAGHHRAAA
jgi:alkylation response protein AidB-like acyl-CoA dehydrogenase